MFTECAESNYVSHNSLLLHVSIVSPRTRDLKTERDRIFLGVTRNLSALNAKYPMTSVIIKILGVFGDIKDPKSGLLE
jgi:hypothetical protein